MNQDDYRAMDIDFDHAGMTFSPMPHRLSPELPIVDNVETSAELRSKKRVSCCHVSPFLARS